MLKGSKVLNIVISGSPVVGLWSSVVGQHNTERRGRPAPADRSPKFSKNRHAGSPGGAAGTPTCAWLPVAWLPSAAIYRYITICSRLQKKNGVWGVGFGRPFLLK
jgi:hypothetical protein